MSGLGVVVIGRNEAHNLRRCFASVATGAAPVVFVDSGSTDDSVEIARGLGVDVIELDPSEPFTVARARNAGFEHLVRRDASLDFVQFVDGDSELVDGWFEVGAAALEVDAGLGVVFGVWHERDPRASIFARVYHLDSDVRLDGGSLFPGISMMRVAAFRQAGGFCSTLEAAEDHELASRMKRAGWRLARLDTDMAVHSSAISNWRIWWRRHLRGGHALAQLMLLHGLDRGHPTARRSLSVAFWALLLPIAVLLSCVAFGASGLLLLAAYPTFVTNIYRHLRRLGFERGDAGAYALLSCASKFPLAVGYLRFHLQRFGLAR